MLHGRILALLTLTLSTMSVAQQTATQAPFLADLHQSKGLTCASCHADNPPKSPAADQTCVNCHGGVAAIISRTDNYFPNPHVSPHSAVPQCTTCHHGHKPFEIACRSCHADRTFVKQYNKP
jgi:fumarate reductase flavoprotein subunit